MGCSNPRWVVVMHEATRCFGSFTAVDHISLEVAEGTILGVIGPSGSGKTTVIRMLNGTLEPSSGSVRVLGEDPRHFRRQTRECIGYMPQHFQLYPELTVSENLSFVGSLYGLLWPRRRRRVREMLELVGLWDARNRESKDLSGGMQRRLELASALIHEPTLLFMDEPTAGIDPVLRQSIWDEFQRLRETGCTLLVTTQYVTEAEYCDRVALIAEGKLIALDEPDRLRKRALGGDIIEIETEQPVDAAALSGVEGVRAVRQKAMRKLVVVTEEGATATPKLLHALAEQRVEVQSTREYHPAFDEVFTELVSQHRDETAGRNREWPAA